MWHNIKHRNSTYIIISAGIHICLFFLSSRFRVREISEVEDDEDEFECNSCSCRGSAIIANMSWARAAASRAHDSGSERLCSPCL